MKKATATLSRHSLSGIHLSGQFHMFGFDSESITSFQGTLLETNYMVRLGEITKKLKIIKEILRSNTRYIVT